MAENNSNPATKEIGATKNYEYKEPVNPNGKMFCGRTGIDKKWGDLTDADIEKMIGAGHKGLTKKAKAPARTTN